MGSGGGRVVSVNELDYLLNHPFSLMSLEEKDIVQMILKLHKRTNDKIVSYVSLGLNERTGEQQV